MERRTSENAGAMLSLLTLLWFFSGALSQIQMPQTSVEVKQGQLAMLQAAYTGSDTARVTVVWNYLSDKAELVISYTGGSVNLGDRFNTRVRFAHTMPNRNVSIYINNTVEPDSGRYMCQVLPGVTETVKELTLNVLVPPAVPECKLQGKPALGANVTLTCHCSAGKPTPKYKWSKTSPSTEIFFSPMLNEATGILKLNKLSSNMSGKYECSASNSVGESKCYINLEVITANAGVIAGATVGALVGLILLILLVLFLWKRRRNTEDDLANDIKEDAQAPKRISWAKSGTGSDIVSKNGTLSSVNSSSQLRDTYSHNPYPYPHAHPIYDTSSITTATGSITGYRPRPMAISATPEDTLPGYNTNPTQPHGPPVLSNFNGGSLPRTEAAQPPPSHQPHVPTGISIANISRMGGVPIMVPAQNQAGSLV
ncbi:endothelial cell adhesion molecule a isoform X2 [Electrophorus electricus]|uniref:Ig-like domain-containing protein n=1 Tax=Electrophorus electricus TaxID=8005 RepID=A0A4W4F3Q8_ELEEL|nr:endothelial cell adhesion molecule a isoform X2 [Electrophorus electricus]